MTHVPFAFWLVEALEPELLVERGTLSVLCLCTKRVLR